MKRNLMSLASKASININRLFPKEVVCVEGYIQFVSEDIYQEEKYYIENAIEKRQSEFKAGRVFVKKALNKFGIYDYPVLMGDNRAPIWPNRIVGSISHTREYCGVAVGFKSQFQTIGLDIEIIQNVEKKLWKYFCTKQELSWLENIHFSEQQKMAAIVFSAKECLYKFQNPINNEWFGFKDVLILINKRIGKFKVKFINHYIDNETCLTGKFLSENGYVATGLFLETNKVNG